MVEDFYMLFQLHGMSHMPQELNQAIHHKQSEEKLIIN
jgi:hypothetical protein